MDRTGPSLGPLGDAMKRSHPAMLESGRTSRLIGYQGLVGPGDDLWDLVEHLLEFGRAV